MKTTRIITSGVIHCSNDTGSLQFTVRDKPSEGSLEVISSDAVYSLLEGGFSPDDKSFNYVMLYISDVFVQGKPVDPINTPELHHSFFSLMDSNRADLHFDFYPRAFAIKQNDSYLLYPTLLGKHKSYEPRKFTPRSKRSS